MTEASSFDAVWRYPAPMRFGPGTIRELPAVCRRLGMARPLLVTDPGLASLPMIAEAIAANERDGIATALFSSIRSNPTEANVRDGVAAFRHATCDGIIAFGGGSGLDAGKAVALLAQQDDAPLWAFDVKDAHFDSERPIALPPVIAIPTTAGTGSEVGRAAVVNDEASHSKRILMHAGIMPRAVIADPELTVDLPPALTAATGMDALAHNLEAYCCDAEYHPMADGIAVEGMRLIKAWLPVAVKDGRNIAARANMLAAAGMGATAFQKGLGAIHALSHPVGALFDTHHGLTNAVVMPYVLAFNRPVIEKRIVRLARYLDLPDATFDGFQRWILDLRAEIGIPHTLAEIGVEAARLDELADMAAADPTAADNPVSLDVPILKRLFEQSLSGQLN